MRERVQAIAVGFAAIGHRQGVSPVEYLLIVALVTLITLTRYG